MAKKKVSPKPKSKTSGKTKKLATPKSNVKVVPKTSDEARAQANALAKQKTQNAKSGYTARLYSSITSAGNAGDKSLGKKTKVIRIRSGSVGRGGKGGMGGLGAFSLKQIR